MWPAILINLDAHGELSGLEVYGLFGIVSRPGTLSGPGGIQVDSGIRDEEPDANLAGLSLYMSVARYGPRGYRHMPLKRVGVGAQARPRRDAGGMPG